MVELVRASDCANSFSCSCYLKLGGLVAVSMAGKLR